MPAERIEALYTALAHQPIPDRWRSDLAASSEIPVSSAPVPELLSVPPYRPATQPRVPQYSYPPYQPPQHQSRTWNPYNARRAPTRELPDASKSKNEFINGKKKYNADRDGVLCVRCGKIGHIETSCEGLLLPSWNSLILRQLSLVTPLLRPTLCSPTLE